MLYFLKCLENHLLTTILSLASNEYDFGTISVDGNKWSRTWNLKMRRKVNEKLKKNSSSGFEGSTLVQWKKLVDLLRKS